MAFEPLTPDRRRRQTREHLLEAAAQVLAERGFQGASLDEVAAAAGFTKGAVYSNFKNKEDLFLAVLQLLHEREMEALHKTIDEGDVPPESRLSDFVAFMREPEAVAPFSGSAVYLEFCSYALRNPEARRMLAGLENEIVSSIEQIIKTERSRRGFELEESPRDVALFVEAFTRGLGILRTLDPDAVNEDFLGAAINLLARALAPDGEPPV